MSGPTPARVTIRLDLSGFRRAMTQTAAWLAKFGEALYGIGHALHKEQHPRWHRRRCRRCNPAAWPKPLAINGPAYHRRQLARRRRARRR